MSKDDKTTEQPKSTAQRYADWMVENKKKMASSTFASGIAEKKPTKE